ncbi:hypothetical protein GCM10010911_00250 [Paenibacillus nasutitermitis]|uniref:Uncharacterized protein n=1 Tax=Paenibacillus nasutitermitis TaxID=1652958 RepID=A0A916YIS3_9BACL|nr:hypothetical protein GCM10010911_00250 [Paenibacillus nasutitermitis]
MAKRAGSLQAVKLPCSGSQQSLDCPFPAISDREEYNIGMGGSAPNPLAHGFGNLNAAQTPLK